MKIYVVTSGEYSSYGIEQVFLDKKKAEIYCAAHNTDYTYYEVEEYETYDDHIVGDQVICWSIKACFQKVIRGNEYFLKASTVQVRCYLDPAKETTIESSPGFLVVTIPISRKVGFKTAKKIAEDTLQNKFKGINILW